MRQQVAATLLCPPRRRKWTSSNTEDPDAGRPFSSEPNQDAAGIPDGSGTDLPDSKAPRTATTTRSTPGKRPPSKKKKKNVPHAAVVGHFDLGFRGNRLSRRRVRVEVPRVGRGPALFR